GSARGTHISTGQLTLRFATGAISPSRIPRPSMPDFLEPKFRRILQQGVVIPACPLALNAERKLDERRQRALVRYYLAAGAGGLAVGVHTTQFAIRDPAYGLFRPVLH